MTGGTVPLDLHGMNRVQAKTAIDAGRRRGGPGGSARGGATAATAAPPCGT